MSSSAITIPQETLERALSAAFREDVKSLDVESLRMVDAREAAKLLGITPQALRRIACDHFDFGARRTRWSLKELRQLTEKRRVRARIQA